MTIKEFLNQAYLLNEDIESKILQIEHLRVLAEYASAHDMAKARVKSSVPADYLENIVAQIADLESEIRADMTCIVELKKDISCMIDAIAGHDPRLKVILRKRYLFFKPWHQIATDVNRSASYIFSLHSRGLNSAKVG